MASTKQWERFALPGQAVLEGELAILRESLFRYCFGFTKSVPDAEDVVQTTLLKALPLIQGRRSHPNVSALLRRMAKNTWIDHVRRHHPQQQIQEIRDGQCLEPSLEQGLELEDAIRHMMKALTPQQQVVFLLCDVFDYTSTEAASLMKLSAGAIKATLHRARVRISESMPPLMEEGIGDVEITQTHIQTYVDAVQTADIRTLMLLYQCRMQEVTKSMAA